MSPDPDAPVTDRVAWLCGTWLPRPVVAPFASRFSFTHRGFTISVGVALVPGAFGPTIEFHIPDARVLPEVVDTPVP